MRIGIVADIHDDAGTLRSALAAFRACGVEQVVTLGDAFETCRRGEPGVEVARLLSEARAVGVVVVAPVEDGWCAVFDSAEAELTPIRLPDGTWAAGGISAPTA